MEVQSTRIIFDARKTVGERTGVGHYALQLLSRLETAVPVRKLYGEGALFHLRAILAAVRSPGSVYFSPESLVVPVILGSRTAVTIHDITPITHPQRHTLRNIIVHRALLGLGIHRAGIIFTPTTAVRDQIASIWPEAERKIRVTPEGPRETSIRGASPAQKKHVLYVGTIEPRKNVGALIQAFKNSNPGDWILQIAGKVGWLSQGEFDEFERLVASDDAVRYLGYVDDAALERLYQEASIFVYLSEAEGFGLPVLEAMAHGLPCVISDDPALLEVAQDTALVVEIGERIVERTTAALTHLISDPDRRSITAERAQMVARNFSWERTCLETLRGLEEMIAND